MTTAEWRPVVGWEGEYEVSDQGQVRSLARRCVCHWDGRTRGVPARILKMAFAGQAYPAVKLGGAVGRTVHTLVAEAFIGPCPEGQETRHLNGDYWDSRAANLAYGTHLENMADRRLHGNVAAGERNASARLTESLVCEIRTLDGLTQKEMAVRYGVSENTIDRVRNRRAWKHVA